MSMWTRMFPICVSSSLYSVKLCYRPSTKLIAIVFHPSKQDIFQMVFFHPLRQLPGSLARIPPGFSDNAQVGAQNHGVMNKPRQTQIQISTCWECVWQMLFSNLVNRTKACFHMCIVFVCVWFFWNDSSISFEFSPASHLSERDVFHSGRRCTASWSWHPELTVQQPCFVNTTVTQGTDSEQVVFISMCDNKLFVEWHEVLKVYALEKNWGNCTPHHPMFAFASVICSTLRSMEMASVIGLVFDLRIWSIEVGHNWSPFHTMALRFLSLQQHLLTLGACPR